MANLRGWRSTADASSNLPRLQYQALTGLHVVVPIGGNVDSVAVLPTGSQIIFDFAAYWEGELAYRPKYDDTRMVLRGTELPPFSGDDGYMGGIKLRVMVQHHGLCLYLSTSDSAVRAAEALYDAFAFAAEAHAGKLPVHQIAEPRGFSVRFRPDLLYAPVYHLVGWVDRDPAAFGPRLIPPPKPMLLPEVEPAPTRQSGKLFDSAICRGEVIPPKALPAKRRGLRSPQADEGIADKVPY